MSLPEPYYSDGTTTLFHGDCVEVMREMQAGSVDAVVTDPPYGLEFMGKEWDRLALRADGNPNFRPNGKHVEDRDGEKWRPGSTYGAPKKNPRCRNCNGLKTAPENRPSKCRCETPDWDTRTAEYGRTMQVWHEAWCREAFRVLKPGGHMLAFGGTRTYHRLACAVEDAGFEIRDSLMWIHGQGFPKGKNVERDMAVMTCKLQGRHFKTEANLAAAKEPQPRDHVCPPTPESEPYLGYNVALKPAHEPIVVARKPLSEPSVARNVLKHGCGAINVDGCRILGAAGDGHWTHKREIGDGNIYGGGGRQEKDFGNVNPHGGRFPSNLLLSHVPPDENGEGGCVPVGRRKVKPGNGSGVVGKSRGPESRKVYGKLNVLDEHHGYTYTDPDGFEEVQAYECARDEEGRLLCAVALLDEQSGTLKSGKPGIRGEKGAVNSSAAYGAESRKAGDPMTGFGDSGGASRFFQVFSEGEPPFKYVAKASRKDRGEGNSHPTTKPTALLQYLVRLVCRPGGTVLDPFLGSGTTAVACIREGMGCIGIEQESEYVQIARTRIAHATNESEGHRDKRRSPSTLPANGTNGIGSQDSLWRDSGCSDTG